MPRCLGVLDEKALFLQSIVSTDGREHPLGVSDRDLILKFGAHDTDPWSLMATVAMSPAIRTRTLRSLYAAIKPSRMSTLRTADCLHPSLATKNFRSISTGT